MNAPESLPGELFLLAYDAPKGKLTARSQLGYVLRAAALAELLLRGNLVDASGRARTPAASPAPATAPSTLDPVLDGVRRQVADAPPRAWRHWVRKDSRAAVHAVRDQLEADRVIRVERSRILGFPVMRITVRQPQTATQLVNRVNSAVRGTQPSSHVDPHDAALVALVAAGDLRVVLSRAQRRRFAARIAQLTEFSGPVAPALHKVIRAARAAAYGG